MPAKDHALTQLFGIIGDPIDQVRSPDLFNTRFREKGIDAVMVPMHVIGDNLEAALVGLRAIENLSGLVITIPHKPALAKLLRSSSDRVRLAGAANALRPCPAGWEGDLFDGEGFVIGLASQGFEVGGKHCSIVGAGGAGAAIALALVEHQAGSIAICDLDEGKAVRLAERLGASGGPRVTVESPGPNSDLVINATPLGMKPSDPLPLSIDTLKSDVLVADIIMKPPETRLLTEAKGRGCRIHEGRHMLESQVPAIWTFFELP